MFVGLSGALYVPSKANSIRPVGSTLRIGSASTYRYGLGPARSPSGSGET